MIVFDIIETGAEQIHILKNASKKTTNADHTPQPKKHGIFRAAISERTMLRCSG